MKAFLLSVFYLLIVGHETKVFDACELFYLLRSYGMDSSTWTGLHQFVCLATFASNLTTNYFTSEGDHPYYGLFRLNGAKWCSNGKQASKNKCSIACDKFLDEDIKDDTECVKKVIGDKEIVSSKQFSEWPLYEKHCGVEAITIIALRCVMFFPMSEWFQQLLKKKKENPLHIKVHK
ncbi:Hypothetical predicted protein [Podarcis lilfordi]|uniref:Glycosyl hydrolases family 22 (GH22) domain-containing protein n=1 Tax=Podarcis lilfordi TaxID=74358 RepID=A0AA35LGC7_9SAUR|nr:Hypothetical predicted protein [Podarcis lilfordi]